ncbi:L,D-transpeptidase [Spirulina sp. CCNP1310]|nr:L,D-transpeptidase [Spirulina sp. CCNP1310]
MQYLQSSKFRLAIIVVVGLGLIYKLAVYRGLIPPVVQLLSLTRPIVCPADATLHQVPNTLINTDQALDQLLPANFDRRQISILIEKSQYRLTVYYNQKPVKSYPVVFGNLVGDKQREGDRKTPEGILKIKDKYPHPSWSKFLWLDYPNAQSECKHNLAKQKGKIPWYSTIGGEIGIHGVPVGSDAMIDLRENWTWGCPSLKNQDINELYDFVQIGTIVEIVA